jgi:hypothetical protein
MHGLWKFLAWLAVVIMPGGVLLLPWLAADAMRGADLRRRRADVSTPLPPTTPAV